MNSEEIIAKKPLPAELFLPWDANLKFEAAFELVSPLRPCRKSYLPFFRELSYQISKQITEKTGKKPDKYLFMVLDIRFDINTTYEDEPYIKTFSDYEVQFIEKWYEKNLIKLHYNGYSYAEVTLGCEKWNAKSPGHLWIRWKSLLPEYEYIDYDCELDLTEKDIAFEICTELPEYIRQKAESLYENPDNKVDCNSWIDSLKNGTYLPRRKKKLPKNKKSMFEYELSPECAYPDVLYTLWFQTEITQALKDRVECAFAGFMELWNEKHEEDSIHDMANAEGIIEVPENTICYAVDFGNADPKAIIELLKHLHNSDLGINRARVS